MFCNPPKIFVIVFSSIDCQIYSEMTHSVIKGKIFKIKLENNQKKNYRKLSKSFQNFTDVFCQLNLEPLLFCVFLPNST